MSFIDSGVSLASQTPPTSPSVDSLAVSDVVQMLADQSGIALTVEGVDDLCQGLIVDSDMTLNAFLTQHAVAYNWLIRDGNPVKLIRRSSSESADFTIAQSECLAPDGSPAIRFRRVDPNALPSRVELHYIDPDRQYVSSTQVAVHPGALTTNPQMVVTIQFVIDAATARALAYSILYRMWSQQLVVDFEHDDMRIEVGDIISLTSDQGAMTLIVLQADLSPSRTVQASATVLFDQSGIDVTTTSWDGGLMPNNDLDGSAWLIAVL